MIKAIMKIHTTSSTVTFVCGDVAIIGNGEFRASSGKVDGFLSCMPTLYSMKTGRSSHGMNKKI